MIKRTDIINYYLGLRPSPKSYLEIGVRNTADNYNHIAADNKDGVDPNPECLCNHIMTSDEFFRSNTKKYDVIFIDGLHLYDQAYKDATNALGALKEGGIVIMHDCNPTKEEHQVEVYRGGTWNGTVWKAFVRMRVERDDLEMFVINADWGVGVIKPNKGQEVFDCYENIYENVVFAPLDIYDYKVFDKHRKEALNLLSVEEWRKKEGINA